MTGIQISMCVQLSAWKSCCLIAWMRYLFSQLHGQGGGDHYLPGPPSL